MKIQNKKTSLSKIKYPIISLIIISIGLVSTFFLRSNSPTNQVLVDNQLNNESTSPLMNGLNNTHRNTSYQITSPTAFSQAAELLRHPSADAALAENLKTLNKKELVISDPRFQLLLNPPAGDLLEFYSQIKSDGDKLKTFTRFSKSVVLELGSCLKDEDLCGQDLDDPNDPYLNTDKTPYHLALSNALQWLELAGIEAPDTITFEQALDYFEWDNQSIVTPALQIALSQVDGSSERFTKLLKSGLLLKGESQLTFAKLTESSAKGNLRNLWRTEISKLTQNLDQDSTVNLIKGLVDSKISEEEFKEVQQNICDRIQKKGFSIPAKKQIKLQFTKLSESKGFAQSLNKTCF